MKTLPAPAIHGNAAFTATLGLAPPVAPVPPAAARFAALAVHF